MATDGTDRRRSGSDLDGLAGVALSYPERGASRDDDLPAVYRHTHRREPIGTGREAFEYAAEVVSGWRMHRGAGLGVHASAPVAREGVVVVLTVGPSITVGRATFGVRAPCRVVYTVEEANRRGFAYGTLPGHPERGEEAFMVEIDPGGGVHLSIRAFSRPATALARAGGPLTRAVQRVVTDRYARALRAAVARRA